MIKMIKGTYGLSEKGTTVAMTRRSSPFSLSATEEKRLVDAGVAAFVSETKPGNSQTPPKPTAKAGTKTETAEKAPDETGSEA